MRKVLVVEDSPMVVKVLKHVLSGSQMLRAHYARSFEEAKALIDTSDENYFAALVDLNLPDAPDGEVVDYTLGKKIPTIVLTGSFSEERREKLLAKGIVDYVTKEGRYSYDYALNMLERLIKNQSIQVLVVDDSSTARKFVSTLLRTHLFPVLEATDGVQAIKVLLENPDIKLLITDFNMPRMDGCELVKNIRHKYEKSDLVIIGLSSEKEKALSARFIKNGANDFLRKPFHHEEFYCRISHNVEFIELIESIRDIVNRDDLTGAYNRKYFYECGEQMFKQSQVNNTLVSAAIIDLDDFHHINEQFGHKTGDQVMKAVAHLFKSLLEPFTYARAGGKEFYLIMPGLDNDKSVAFVEKVRQIVCSSPVDIGQQSITVTFSAGVSSITGDTIDDLMNAASLCLRRAKEAGGDLVFGDEY